MFSIVIPLFNKEYSIIRSLDSVYNQTFKNYEVIIIDDGSTDNSKKIVEGYIENKCNFKIFSQNNSGVSEARNIGVKRSSYEFVCFLDADDEWDSNFLESMKKLIDTYDEASLFCVQHKMISTDDNKVKINKSSYPNNYMGYVDDFFKRSLKGSIANSSKVCIRKEKFIKLGGFPVGEKSGEDLFLWIKFALNYPVAFCNIPLVNVYFVPDYSRAGRDISIPYPFLYYSDSAERNKMTFWLKMYLRKIIISHLFLSFKESNLTSFKARRSSIRNVFPMLYFSLGLPLLTLKVREYVK
ncbi:glycosyltransferase family 2 protein [Vibrio sp. D415a]|uniref:glycosyltransferase family 2 protein n=1 Tax=unclassified Vibrio TaxID=2614977 RepID=UPI0025539463|nr:MULTISPECIES: glycosyltransferase family A protein [unclassified Vibrio]MDK9729628.1 glycosyltransferase family 2 protein [Vibrio sp. D415a]MDK9745918.1 glycosyltransferase family 2 protein [Vibrio sp. D409a]MDK9765614.1 glycosyltransferase family 2 protein [Vibrio sp. D417a]MDK9785789.1 glycosyltransferase family 2 protein [Vibrio sp. D421a]